MADITSPVEIGVTTGLNRRQLNENSAAEDELPYRYFWPDGEEAIGDQAKAEWQSERERRWHEARG